MKQILKQIKSNWLSLLLPIIFVSFLLINLNVVYFGDDFYYLSYKNLHFIDYFTELAKHYQQINGRFIVHLLATLFLKLTLPIWQILNSLMLTGICYFATKVITQDKKEKQPLIISIFFFLIASLNITITRQSVYWLTGSFNYVYPMLLFFAYWYCLTKIDSKKYFIFAILLGFLASASVEQAGVMTFGLTILTYLSHFTGFKNFKLFFKTYMKQFILILVTLIGVSTVVLAPSQWIRLEEENNTLPMEELVLNNAKYLLFSFSSESNVVPFIALFAIALIGYSIQKIKGNSKIILTISIIFNFIFAIVNVYFINANYYYTPTRILLILGMLSTYGIAIFFISKNMKFGIINPLTIAIVLMVGSQFMMIISPVLGSRNLIPGFLLFAYLISFVVHKLDIKQQWIGITILCLLAISSNIRTALGYYETKKVNDENLQIIEKNQSILQDKTKEITLYKFPDDNYAWSMPYISTYHEYWMKQTYNIQCQINWK